MATKKKPAKKVAKKAVKKVVRFKKMKKIFCLAFMLVLTVSLASAFWPFQAKMTGNVIDDSAMKDTDTCRDYDSGVYTLKAGFVVSKTSSWFKTSSKTSVDSCLGSSVSILDKDGKKVGTGRTQIKEYYCEDGSLKEYLADSALLGEGYCTTEKITVDGKTISAAKWIKTEAVCVEVEGGVKDGYSKTYKDYCDNSNNFIDYSCKEGKVVNATTLCSGKCNTKSGCNSFCNASSDSDVNQNPEVWGYVYFNDGGANDTCAEKGSSVVIKQYSCKDNLTLKEETTTFKDTCDGNTFVDYSCSPNALKKETTTCQGSCNLDKGGCYGFCNASSDTDPTQNVLVAGTVNNGGKLYGDSCGKSENGLYYVKQYFCENSQKIASNTTYCSKEQECVNDVNGLGYCRDKISTTDTVKALENKISELTSLVSSLTTKIDELSSRLAALESTK